jgi:AhpD family alkylhydroperoxidase
MSDLTPRELELVALGAAMGSNCTPCIEYHAPAARKVGLSNAEIQAAIQHADKIRQVPARKTLQTALGLVAAAAQSSDFGTAQDCGCGSASQNAATGSSEAAQPRDMLEKMSRIMKTCGKSGQTAGTPGSFEPEPTAHSTSEGCGCG